MESIAESFDNVLYECSQVEREDRDRRQKEIEHLPVSVDCSNVSLQNSLFISRAVAQKNTKRNSDGWKRHSNKSIKTNIENVRHTEETKGKDGSLFL